MAATIRLDNDTPGRIKIHKNMEYSDKQLEKTHTKPEVYKIPPFHTTFAVYRYNQ